MRKLAWIAAASAVLVLTVILGLRLLGGQHGASAAPSPGGVPLNMMIDPDTTGNTCAMSPTDCNLGTVEECVRVNVADGAIGDATADFEVDVVIDDPAGDAEAPTLYDAWVTYPLTKVLPKTKNDKALRMPGSDTGGTEPFPEPAPDGVLSLGRAFIGCEPIPGADPTAINCDDNGQGATYIGDGPVARIGMAVQLGANCKASEGGCVADFGFHSASNYFSLGGYTWPQYVANTLTFKGAQVAINKECPAEADVEIVSQVVKAANCTSAAPTEIDAGVVTDLCLVKTIRNNGTETPVDVSIAANLVAPGCNPTADPANPDSYTGLTSTPVDVNELFTVNCADPSLHSFNFVNDIDVTTPDVTDPDETNNSKTTPYNVDVLAEADVSVSQQMFAGNCLAAPPTELPQGGNVNVCVKKTIANAGPYTGSITVSIAHTATPASGCTAVAAPGNLTSKTFSGASTTVDEIWTLNCPNTGTGKTFTFNNVIAVTTTHVTDPDGTDNSDSEDLTVDVTASADARIRSWVFPDEMTTVAGNQLLVVPGVAEDLDTTETLDNNDGTYGGASIDVTIAVPASPGAGCAAAADPGNPTTATLLMNGTDVVDTLTWDVTLTPATSCTISFDKTITITTAGVSDSNPADNTASRSVILVADTDGDTVPDNYNGTIDNCPDDANPDQLDTDGDDIGDVCDPDIDGDGILNASDNCVLIANAGQEDADTDDIGNVCELDVNCSGGGPNGADALMVLQRILGRVGLDPTQCPAPNGDLYGPRASAYVAYDPAHPELVGTGRDALMILQCILGRNNIVCPLVTAD